MVYLDAESDDSIWSATCFVIRKGYRRHGVITSLAEAAVVYER
ncbi:hypothetical protein GCM10010435_07200 [Winogradskya consettensis]|uniref:Uncharacterized protein n=1 Tax=Winogradskya consettensis TaxID=113560 RepID=A0A919SPZ5_9ACTN|nr:hypothetical protein [Actinoplanes consettensis]GIM75779.1 hypothetical protein Aco04nite_47040 [Actinoplanes consettensis]